MIHVKPLKLFLLYTEKMQGDLYTIFVSSHGCYLYHFAQVSTAKRILATIIKIILR
jgi:hypothetical protein